MTTSILCTRHSLNIGRCLIVGYFPSSRSSAVSPEKPQFHQRSAPYLPYPRQSAPVFPVGTFHAPQKPVQGDCYRTFLFLHHGPVTRISSDSAQWGPGPHCLTLPPSPWAKNFCSQRSCYQLCQLGRNQCFNAWVLFTGFRIPRTV